MNPVDAAAIALIALFALVIAGGLVLCGLAIHWRRSRAEAYQAAALPGLASEPNEPCVFSALRPRRPARRARTLLQRLPRACAESQRFTGRPFDGAFRGRTAGPIRRPRPRGPRWAPPAEE